MASVRATGHLIYSSKVKWTRRPVASATLIVDYLHLVWQDAAEDAEWQIAEIKSSLR